MPEKDQEKSQSDKKSISLEDLDQVAGGTARDEDSLEPKVEAEDPGGSRAAAEP